MGGQYGYINKIVFEQFVIFLRSEEGGEAATCLSDVMSEMLCQRVESSTKR